MFIYFIAKLLLLLLKCLSILFIITVLLVLDFPPHYIDVYYLYVSTMSVL